MPLLFFTFSIHLSFISSKAFTRGLIGNRASLVGFLPFKELVSNIHTMGFIDRKTHNLYKLLCWHWLNDL